MFLKNYLNSWVNHLPVPRNAKAFGGLVNCIRWHVMKAVIPILQILQLPTTDPTPFCGYDFVQRLKPSCAH